MVITTEDLKIWALTIWGEARGEDLRGQFAVARVIYNRATKHNKPIKDVCLQRYQFSCWNPDDPNHKIIANNAFDISTKGYWQALDAIQMVVRVVGNEDPIKGATHYCTLNTHPYWANNKEPCAIIGNHKFYNNID